MAVESKITTQTVKAVLKMTELEPEELPEWLKEEPAYSQYLQEGQHSLTTDEYVVCQK